MSSDYDIEMSTDDTLEIDAIVKEWNSPKDVINKIKHNGDSTEHQDNLQGIQKSTAVFDPPKSGEYTIDINGQELIVNVINTALSKNIIDDYEQGQYEDKNNTLSTYYNNTNNQHVRSANDPVIQKSYSLKLSDQSLVYSESTDGLNRYFSKGEIVSILAYDKKGEPKMMFGVENDNSGVDCYMARHQAGSKISIEKWVDGSYNGDLANTSVSTNLNEWYEIELEWHNGTGSETDNTMVLNLYSVDQSTGDRQSQIDSCSASDSDYSNQTGVGYELSSGNGTAVFDYFKYISDV